MPQPTQEVQGAITLLHRAMVMEPEPEDKATISQCLTALTRLQAKNMKEQQGGPGAGGPPVAAGYAGGSPPAGPANPLAALASRMGG